jgi:hypothetical protein
MQISDNSSDKKWDNDLKIYLNLEKVKTGIIVARVESAKKKDSKMLPSSAIRMIKKKIKFKKRITVSKISRFSEYI